MPCVGGSAGHILVGAFFSCASSLSDARPVDSIEWTLMGEESAPANSGTAACAQPRANGGGMSTGRSDQSLPT